MAAAEPQASPHSAELIDGKAIAATIREEIKAEVAKLHETTGKVSCLTRALHAAVPQRL